jgi:hypothetical protein
VTDEGSYVGRSLKPEGLVSILYKNNMGRRPARVNRAPLFSERSGEAEAIYFSVTGFSSLGLRHYRLKRGIRVGNLKFTTSGSTHRGSKSISRT